VENWIVMNYNYPIAGCVNVELDSVSSELDRAEKGRNGILGQGVVSPAVRDRRWDWAAWSQAFLDSGSIAL